MTSRFGAALSQHPVPATAVGEVVGDLLERVGEGATLATLFVTQPHAGALEDAAGVVQEILKPQTLIGCTAESVLANSFEAEARAAVSLWVGDVGPTVGVELRTENGRVAGWPDVLPFQPAAVVLFADPFTFDPHVLFAHLGADAPLIPVIGGNASGGHGPGAARLALGRGVRAGGAVAAVLGPGAAVVPVVSQGCRPVGRPWTVTASDGRWLLELGGVPAWERVQELATDDLSDEDHVRLQRGLQLGVLVDEHKADFGAGDFLVRNLRGGNRERGALAVDGPLEIGQTVQFHLRDAEAADADLRQALLARADGPVAGVLLFTCNGRGTRLFAQPHHDAAAVSDLLGRPATAGFFAQGEFGPVGNRNFVHGFSASMALFGDG